MKEDVLDSWLAALESGDYKHSKGYLRESDDCFCPLGVLCDLYIKEHDDVKWEKVIGSPKPENTGHHYTIKGNSGFLPIEVQMWAGVDSEDPVILTVEYINSRNETSEDDVTVSELNDRMYDDLGFNPVISALRTMKLEMKSVSSK